MRFGGDWTPESLSENMTGCLGENPKGQFVFRLSGGLWEEKTPRSQKRDILMFAMRTLKNGGEGEIV